MKSKLIAMSFAGLAIVGCTTQPVDKNAMSNAELQAALADQQQEWQAMKPQLQRILALEADLKLLVETLDDVPESSASLTEEMSPKATPEDEAEAPVLPSSALADMEAKKQQAEKDRMPPANQEPFKQQPPKGAVTAQFYDPKAQDAGSKTNTAHPYYGVQLAAYASKELAIQGWQTVSRNHAEEFADTAPLINRQVVKGKTYYQLIVGPFIKKAYSVDFCNMLKQMQQDCLVTRYRGEPFLSL